jgi:hypothetical protein
MCLHKETLVPKRFIFRQVCSRDLPIFLNDGEIRSKNHTGSQYCHQTSYREIVERRGTGMFALPHGGVVNDYVPFYFSPITSFTYTIHKGNVDLRSPDGDVLCKASDDERIFFVCEVDSFSGSGLNYCFSNFALNSRAPMPALECDLAKLADHVHWSVFDDRPLKAKIPEIGYEGVCEYFSSQDSPPERQNRSQKRMAEFLVKDAVPLTHIVCIVAKTPAMQQSLQHVMDASNWSIPIHAKPGCYF